MYGAGPITDLTDKQYLEWRLYAKKEFEKDGVGFIIPTRLQGLMGEKMGVIKDFGYIDSSQVLLVNLLRSKKVSIGTVIEYGWATALGWAKKEEKTIITIVEQHGNPHEHSFIRDLTDYIFEDLDSGIIQAKKILLEPKK